MAQPVSPITPAQIIRLRIQLAITGQAFAERINEATNGLRLDRNAVSRYERGVRTPDYRIETAIARLWLHAGYPCTVGGLAAVLTTNSSAANYGLPVVLIDGMPHGSAEVGAIDLGDAPVMIVETARRAGYEVIGGTA